MTPELRKTIELRKEKNNQLFYISTEVIMTSGEYEVVRKKKLIGLNNRAGFVFEPIYDEIQFLNDYLCKIRVEDFWGLADCRTSKILLDFGYTEISLLIDGMVETVNQDGLKGLYDTKIMKEIIPPDYEEFGSPIGVEYIWIRKGKFYDFIEKSSGRVIRIGGLSKVYDSRFGMFGVNDSGRVIMIGPDGYENPHLLRKTVIDAGGYLCLKNYLNKTEDYIDVYGNILNG